MKRKQKRVIRKIEAIQQDAPLASLEYLKESRNYVYAIALLFLVCAIAGFFLADYLHALEEQLKGIVDKTQDLSTPGLIAFIFFNNIQSAAIGLIGGLLLGIIPVINAATNGVVLGYVFARVYKITGFADFWRILPHGIFELPAVFIALGLGLKLGLSFFQPQPFELVKDRFKKSIITFVEIVVPLLIVAAIIEGILIALST